MPIVDPGPIWKVDSARELAMPGFSHSLGPLLPSADMVSLPKCSHGLIGGRQAG
jgi:hypothetical protein